VKDFYDNIKVFQIENEIRRKKAEQAEKDLDTRLIENMKVEEINHKIYHRNKKRAIREISE
jgi:hypothetical protein